MKFDHAKFISLYELQYGGLDSSQALGLSELLSFLERDNHVNDVRWAAYMLATVKHECAERWQPSEESGKGQGKVYGNPITVTVSEGKIYANTYYGRGYVQLKWVGNYREMSYNLNLGDDLLIHPQWALEPSIAYRIMSFGMRNGSFTGLCLKDYISGSRCVYYDARQIVNGFDQAALIQRYADILEALLRESADEKRDCKGTGRYHIDHSPEGLQARKARQHKLSDRTNNPEQQPD
jgi:putative chitinase